MSVKLEVELEDKASSVADRIATKLDALASKVEAAQERQSTTTEREAFRAARAQEREASRAARAQEREAARVTASAEREAAQQTRSAEREAARQTRAAEREARDRIRAQEREARATERSRGKQLRALREADRERKRREGEERRASNEVIRRRKREHEEAEKGAKDGFWWNFKANLAANAVGKMVEWGGAALTAAHNLGRAREQQGFFFEGLSKGEKGNLGLDYLAHADALAERFGLSLEETRLTYQKLLGIKQTPDAIDKTIRLSADLQRLGNSEERISEIYDALNQIYAKGFGVTGDIATEAIGRLGVTDADFLKAVEKSTGKRVKTLDEFFGKKGRSAQETGDLMIQAIAISKGINSPGEIAAKYADTTLSGIEDKAWAKAKLIGEKVSSALLESARPGIKKLADWLANLDPDQVAKDFAKRPAFADFYANPLSAFTAEDNKKVLSSIGNGVLGAGEWLWGALGLGGPQAADAGAAVKDKVAGGASKDPGRFEQIGAQMGAGLVKGLDGAGPSVAEAGARLTDAAASGLEDKAEIHSPSRLFMRDGLHMGEGLSLGLDRSAADVQDAADRMVPTLDIGEAEPVPAPVAQATEAYAAPAPQPNPTAAVAGYGGATVQVTAPISITVGGDGQTAQAVTQELRRSLRREVENMFEEVALQAGASP